MGKHIWQQVTFALQEEKKQQVAKQNYVSIKIAAGLLQFSRDILKGCVPDWRSGRWCTEAGNKRGHTASTQQDVNTTVLFYTL